MIQSEYAERRMAFIEALLSDALLGLSPLDRRSMTLGTILLIVLILLLVGALPTWPHSSGWGYGPTGGLGVLLIIVIVLLVLGVI